MEKRPPLAALSAALDLERVTLAIAERQRPAMECVIFSRTVCRAVEAELNIAVTVIGQRGSRLTGWRADSDTRALDIELAIRSDRTETKVAILIEGEDIAGLLTAD